MTTCFEKVRDLDFSRGEACGSSIRRSIIERLPFLFRITFPFLFSRQIASIIYYVTSI